MRCYDGKCIFIFYVIELFTKFDQNCVPSPWCPSSAGLSVSGWGPFLRDPIQHRRNLHSLRLAPPDDKTGLLYVYVYSCTVLCTCGPTRPLMTSGAWPRDLSSSRLLPCDKTGFVPVRVYTACVPCCPGETAGSRPASRLCSPRRSSCPGQRRSRGLHSLGSPENRKVNQTFYVWMSCEW